MKYYAYYDEALNDEYNIINYICESDDTCVPKCEEKRYEIDEKLFNYLNGKVNFGVLKTNILEMDNIVEVDLKIPVSISDKTVYLVGYITKPLNNIFANYISCIRIIHVDDYYDDNLFLVTTKEIYHTLNTPENFSNMCFNSLYFDISLKKLSYISEIRGNIVSSDNKNIDVEEKLDIYKKYTIFEAKNLLLSRFDSLATYDFFHFTLLNNKLISKGFIITDENREDKYIEVIEKDDEELLNLLSKYLEIYDNLHTNYYFYNQYLTFTESILEADSIEECKNVFDTFSDSFS